MARTLRLICPILLAGWMFVGCTDSSPGPGGMPDGATSAPQNEFNGTFLFAHDPGEPGFKVTLEPDGTAWSTANGPDTKTPGRWRLTNGAAWIEWDDGWRNELRRSSDGWTQRTWAPGSSDSDPPEKTVPASRLR